MNTTTTSTGKRRRATTIAQQERILDMATGLPMTKNVLREVMADATSANLDLIERWFGLELEQRARSRKTHLACAIGRLACLNDIPVRFFTATSLLMRLRRAREDHRLDHELAAIGKARLLIIDEFGYMPIDEEGSRLLFQIISDSYETRSVIYTTNIEFSGWGRILGDANMAAALIDRTVHHGRLIRFQGESYRSQHALMTR